jgi:hypothetical protein
MSLFDENHEPTNGLEILLQDRCRDYPILFSLCLERIQALERRLHIYDEWSKKVNELLAISEVAEKQLKIGDEIMKAVKKVTEKAESSLDASSGNVGGALAPGEAPAAPPEEPEPDPEAG